MNRRAFILIILGALMLSGCMQGGTGGSLSGYVLDVETGKGMEGVTITFGNDSFSITDEDGFWLASGIKKGAKVTAAREGTRFLPPSYTFVPRKDLVFYATSNPAVKFVPTEFNSIQLAINACEDGDVVVVAQGTYYENIDYMGKSITVRSLVPTDPSIVSSTIIDGGKSGSVVSFVRGESQLAVLAGFTIQNGSGRYFQTREVGGGIAVLDSEPSILHNVIQDNTADCGGGIFMGALSYDGETALEPIIRSNTIQNNQALASFSQDIGGGGIFIGGNMVAFVEGNLILDNKAEHAGGIGIEQAGATIRENQILRNGATMDGGGLYAYYIYDWNARPVLVEENIFESNSANRWGGGLFYGYSYSTETQIVSNAFNKNHSNVSGGGLHVDVDGLTVVNRNNFSQNSSGQGGGLYLHAYTEFVENTFSQNKALDLGGGLYQNVRSILVDELGAEYSLPSERNDFSTNTPDDYYIEAGRL